MTWSGVYHEKSLPYLTAGLAGIGGLVKRYNEDFQVEEIPLYPSCGEGTHVYFSIEKSGMTTPAAIERIARALGRPPRDIGYAGLKDAHGVTRQQLSLEHVDPERVLALRWDRLRVLGASRHTNKLKLGHLAGNRFKLRIRDLPGSLGAARDRSETIMSELARRGVPNYFGAQRFGARGDNALIGRSALLGDFAEALAWMLGRPGALDHGEVYRARELFDAGDYEGASSAWPGGFRDQSRVCRTMARSGGNAQKGWRAVPAHLRRLFLSALQSALFNEVLARRIATLDHIEIGDMAWKHANGACFRVEDAELESPRCTSMEISATGPLFGKRMTPAEAHPGEIEARVLADAELRLEQMRQPPPGDPMDGARRPLRVPLRESSTETGDDDRGAFLQLQFELPAGAYATIVTREVCKSARENDA